MAGDPGAPARLAAARGFVFDMDGTLVLGDRLGHELRPLPGAVEIISWTAARRLPFVVFTNGTTRTPGQLARVMRNLGFEVADSAMMTPASSAVRLFTRLGHERVMVLGGAGLAVPLREAGLSVVPPVSGSRADAVLVGWYPEFTMAALEAACHAVWDGALLYSCSQTPFFAVDGGYGGRALGTSRAISAMIRSLTGCPVRVVGKPSLDALRGAAERLRVPVVRLAVVGDDPELEVPMARRGRALAIAVGTGLGGAVAGEGVPASRRPHLRVRGVDELLAIVKGGALCEQRVTSLAGPAFSCRGVAVRSWSAGRLRRPCLPGGLGCQYEDMVDPRAGQPAAPDDLVDVAKLVTAYYAVHPDPGDATQRVSFGTSGHRGSAFTATFNEDHILATTQAICEYRAGAGIYGPLYLGVDTHALSEPAQVSALEVLAANDVRVLVDARGGYTPTPAVSRAILAHNASGSTARADGIVVTPSHNPPSDGGFKYNPPDGGPAGTDITRQIQDRANELLAGGLKGVGRIPYARAAAADTTGKFDFLGGYLSALEQVIGLSAIRTAGVRIGADPLGGASVAYWGEIGDLYGLDLTVVNPAVDPTFRFMTLDWDGKIRMDCSSPYAMASLIARQHEFTVATGNDTDADRHGIVTPDAGLLNPNHYLSVAIDYLYRHRDGWPPGAAVGKTLVSSSMIDRVTSGLGRELLEVPVGFKWFVPGLLDGSVAFGGEESAGASFLRHDGSVWTTDKDGIILALLASEITAVTGRSPSEHYRDLTDRYGDPAYARIDSPATREQKEKLARLSPSDVSASELAGEKIVAALTTAPGNGAPIGGLKVVAESGWFAARPSGTEDVYKLYAESFRGPDHLAAIQAQAQEIIAAAIGG